MKLEELSIYQQSCEVARNAWAHYAAFNVATKRIAGDQWIRSIDSIGANIAEGFGRYHFADRNKFNYNARGSLFEAIHWTKVLGERRHIDEAVQVKLVTMLDTIGAGLNAYINATKSRTSR